MVAKLERCDALLRVGTKPEVDQTSLLFVETPAIAYRTLKPLEVTKHGESGLLVMLH
jgi:hypothetical protein